MDVASSVDALYVTSIAIKEAIMTAVVGLMLPDGVFGVASQVKSDATQQ